MKDLIDRNTLIQMLGVQFSLETETDAETVCKALNELIEQIKAFPAEGKCGECQYFEYGYCHNYKDGIARNRFVHKDDYCSRGVWKLG